MKHYLPITAFLGLTLACAPPQKLSSTESNSVSNQKEKKVLTDQKIAPGTCSVSVVGCKVQTKNNELWLTGKVERIIGYGAGFSTILNKNQEIKILLSKQHSTTLGNSDRIVCTIAVVNRLNKTDILELIDHQ